MKYKKIIGTLILAFSFNTLTPLFSTKAQAKTDPPNIVGQYAITIDADTGEVIYSKNGDAKSYPASTTKLLTALLLAENKNKEDILKFTESALKQPDYALYRSFGPIPLGTTMSADDVMKSLMLFSGNDIAYLIADNVAGDTSKFSDMMNAKLKEWGLNNSHFVNPNGLHHDNHYTTPFELAVITKKAYENPWVKETMAQSKATVNTSLNKPINLENRNKNVGTDGCVAGKTGYTSPAGRSLAAVYERDGRTIIGVVMKSAYDVQDTQVFKDMKNIIDYSYAAE
ncbi:D-alanyl-D-alanine carboxypeptidase family protein, partial [Clostridium polynesiense]|uniref:D-alanyl-D-alanine carboxypeptidase family protein n=1 Tax=Clostridium polynesiense TaxID=1325933 RepID=UPI00058E22E5